MQATEEAVSRRSVPLGGCATTFGDSRLSLIDSPASVCETSEVFNGALTKPRAIRRFLSALSRWSNLGCLRSRSSSVLSSDLQTRCGTTSSRSRIRYPRQ